MKKSVKNTIGDILRFPLIFIGCLLMILFIAGCKPSGESPDNIKPVPISELTTDDFLQQWKARAVNYFGTPDIRIGWYDLNKTPHPDGLIWGTFFGVIPNDQSYMAVDQILKEDGNFYNVIYVIGHEVCHYAQWNRGVRFDLNHIKWSERWYEQECINQGNLFLWDMTKEGF